MTGLPPDPVLRAIWEGLDLAMLVSSSTVIEYVSPAFTRLTGIAEKDIIGAPFSSIVYENVQGRGSARRTPRQPSAEQMPELSLRSKESGPIPVEHVSRDIVSGGRTLTVSTFVPAAERHQIADALASSEQRYRDLFEEDIDGRFVATPEWRVIDCNLRLLTTLGYSDRSQLIGRSVIDRSPDGPILQKLLAVARVEGRAGPAELQMERVDGRLIDVACSLSGGMSPSGELVTIRGQVTEITERKRLETRLQGAERMEVIGRLAGGMAHDFNNLLTVISGNTEKLLDQMAPQDALRASATAIHQAAGRAASMTQQLLAYSRRQVFELQPLSLQTLVANARPMLTEIVGDHIQVNITVREEVPNISADARQIEHVIANLAVNAREAMPSGGTLTMTVDTLDVGEDAPKDRFWLRPGRYVRLTVADDGLGMDPVTKAYAFQPFFTTKRMGNGRGLGLATVYGIVKQSHGFVWIDSEAGQGSTFTLLFPSLKADSASATVTGQPGTSEAILVVEQEDEARTFVCDSLRRRGYQVLDASSSEEALQIFSSHPSRIHLVVADSHLVTSQGTPLASRLKAIDPRVQSLMMLADGDDGLRRVLPTTPVIAKPFTLQALAAKVREVLNSGEGRG
jgi:two-component system, cell cycle sensor histidine kinase and response regulator CckA